MNVKSFIFGFLVGGALSGGTVYFLMKSKNNKEVGRIQKECDDYVLEIKDTYLNKMVQKSTIIKEEPSEIIKRYHDEAGRYVRVDPAEMEGPSEDEAPDEYFETEEPGEVAAVQEGLSALEFEKLNKDRAPEVIRAEEFGQAPGFEVFEYTYYVPDLTFCDENDVIFEDEIRTFGNTVDDWVNIMDNDDPIYVRNYQICCDFKIDKLFCQCPRFVNAHMDEGD